MRVVALGRTETLYETVRRLASTEHNVVAVVTAEAQPEYGKDEDDFKRLTNEIGAEYMYPDDINSETTISRMKNISPDIGVSINWPTLISGDVIDIFEKGIINCHAGDLPKYRGNAAPNWAMIQDEDEVVITLHLMDEGLDSGPILLKQSKEISDDTHIGDIYEFSREEAPKMFVEAIEGLDSGDLSPEPQPDDPGAPIRCYPRLPRDSRLNWNESADYLDRLVLASSEPLHGAYSYLGNEKVRIWESEPEEPEHSYLGTPGQVAERRPSEGDVTVITGDGFLTLQEMSWDGGERVDATEIIESHRDRLGMDVEMEVEKLRQETGEPYDENE